MCVTHVRTTLTPRQGTHERKFFFSGFSLGIFKRTRCNEMRLPNKWCSGPFSCTGASIYCTYSDSTVCRVVYVLCVCICIVAWSAGHP